MLVDIVNCGWAPVYISNLTEDIPGYIEAPANRELVEEQHPVVGECSGMYPDALVRRSTVQAQMIEERPSFRKAFRSLNRLPFVLGLLALVAAGGLLVGLITGTSVVPTPVLVLGTAWMLLLDIVLIALYYRLRE